ncbi:hypothetical protein CANMA_000985 [Candida margitis]|uniref:uncharacterized protein n=1 Tax=Candida margitis TaxID=1775924 RepID=UPI002225BF7B|nr:uncharacterized protein CANMA_000985 [Candida margitis]KAI5969945.1 hypothetical protein CANMA_000985 [Candida margitis]
MPDTIDEPLSSSASRLSISRDRHEVREMLGELQPRRDSAVSMTSDNDTPSKRKRTRRESSNVKEKVHKKKLKKKNAVPSLVFDLSKERLPVRNIRPLILQVFNVPTGHKQTWLKIEHMEKINNVCVCFVPGLQNGLSGLPFPNIVTIETILPGSKDFLYNPLDTICSLPLTKNEKKAILDKSKSEKITIKDLLLSETQLRQLEYPYIDSISGWTKTKPSPTEQSRIFALDCEFCKAENIQVLTRISLIDFDGNVVFDELVKPEEEITDYVTRYSGITKELLQDVNTTIEQIQQLFLKTVFEDDILVGHSLESDLRVMKVIHENIVDTAITYEHARGPPSKPSLRWLAKTFLGRNIQAGEDNGDGHSSIEDAKTCLDLVKLKIQEGRCFGTNVGEIPIFEKLVSSDLKSLLVTYGSQYSQFVEKVEITNDDEAVEAMQSHTANLSIIELKDLEYNLKWDTSSTYDGTLDYNVEGAYKRTNSRLESIYNTLPVNTLFILISQSSNPATMQKLRKIRGNFQRLEREGVLDLSSLPKEESWDIEKSDQLVAETAKARESLTFMKLKE